jgi:hypothetical protein
MQLIWGYLSALSAHWLTLMSAGPFLLDRLVTWFWRWGRQWIDGWRWRVPFLLGIVFIGFQIAGFQAWNDQMKAVTTPIASPALPPPGSGAGGGGDITGDNGTIYGGHGCTQGGGNGGSGIIKGNNGTIVGGDSGCGPTPDGRGGIPQRMPGEVNGLPTNQWQFGRGAAGANQPEYDRRLAILARIHREYLTKFPDLSPFINAGVDQVPLNWVNARLRELQETWQVTRKNGDLILPDLPKKATK